MPIYHGNRSAAVAVMFSGDDGTPKKVTLTPKNLGLTHPGGYIVSEVFEGKILETLEPQQSMTVSVNPSGL